MKSPVWDRLGPNDLISSCIYQRNSLQDSPIPKPAKSRSTGYQAWSEIHFYIEKSNIVFLCQTFHTFHRGNSFISWGTQSIFLFPFIPWLFCLFFDHFFLIRVTFDPSYQKKNQIKRVPPMVKSPIVVFIAQKQRLDAPITTQKNWNKFNWLFWKKNGSWQREGTNIFFYSFRLFFQIFFSKL